MTDTNNTPLNTDHGNDPEWQARALARAALLEQRVAQIDSLPPGALQDEANMIYGRYQQLGRLDQAALYTETSQVLADSLIEVEVYPDQQGINCYYFDRHLAISCNRPVPTTHPTDEQGRRRPPGAMPITVFE